MANEQELLNIYLKTKIGVIGTGQMGTDIFLAFENYINELQNKYNNHSVSSKDIFYLSDSDLSKKEYFGKLGFKHFGSNDEVIKIAKYNRYSKILVLS